MSKAATKADQKPVPEQEAPKAGELIPAKASGGAVTQFNPSVFESDAGAGLEHADKDSFAIPFILCLQPLSPVVVDGTVEGAKAGLFMNSVTNELYEKLEVIPCSFRRSFLRWTPREKGGGFKGEYSPVDVELGKVEGMQLGEDGRYYIGGTNPKEHDRLSDTRLHFVLARNKNGTWSPALVSFASTQIKKSKRWTARIQGIQLTNAQGKAFNPPSWSHVYELSSQKESNEKGTWFGVEVNMLRPVDSIEVYAQGKTFWQQVSEGKVDVRPPADESVGGGGDGEQF